MVMIGSDELIKVFSERTFENLKYISDAQNNGEPVYEATQLINSLLGLIVFPREKNKTSIPNTELSDLQGWPRIADCRDLNDFFRLFRNAIAHCNIHLLGGNEIEGVRFENKNDQSRVTWRQDFTLAEIQEIAKKLDKLLHEEQEG